MRATRVGCELLRVSLGMCKGVTLGGWACAQEAAAQVAATPNEPCANFAKTFTDCMSDSNGDLEACRCALCMELQECSLRSCEPACCLCCFCWRQLAAHQTAGPTGRARLTYAAMLLVYHGRVMSFCALGLRSYYFDKLQSCRTGGGAPTQQLNAWQ